MVFNIILNDKMFYYDIKKDPAMYAGSCIYLCFLNL